MRGFLGCAAIGFLAAMTPSVASAAIINIDDFATPGGSFNVNVFSGSTGFQIAASALGGRREYQATRTTGIVPAFDKITLTQFSSGGTSFLDFDQTSGSAGELLLTYDGSNGTGDLNLDLSGNRKVSITLSQFNLGEGPLMNTYVELFDGTTTTTQTVNVSVAGPQTLTYDFTDPNIAFDFTSVNSIKVYFGADLGSDFRISSILAPEAIAVPEPAALALLGVAALIARRKKASGSPDA